jgi:hypothetical protein
MADPVTIGLGAMAAGGVVRGIGQWAANQDQADAERKNAAYYDEQAAFAEASWKREREIYQREGQLAVGAQMSAFAKAGVDMQGSPLLAQFDTLKKIDDELAAIDAEGAMNVRLARLRSKNSREYADSLSSFRNNALQFGGTILGTGGDMLSRYQPKGGKP